MIKPHDMQLEIIKALRLLLCILYLTVCDNEHHHCYWWYPPERPCHHYGYRSLSHQFSRQSYFFH